MVETRNQTLEKGSTSSLRETATTQASDDNGTQPPLPEINQEVANNPLPNIIT